MSILQKKHKLSAIYIPDTVSKEFIPLSCERPKCLFPLVNIPVIEYILEWLSSNGVTNLYLCLRKGRADELIKDYINNLYDQDDYQMKIEFIQPDNAKSTGDFLRHLDKLGVLVYENDDNENGESKNSSFILVDGDVITNINLADAIKDHNSLESKKIEKMITVCFSKYQLHNHNRDINSDLVVCYDKETNQMVYYNDEIEKGFIELENEIYETHSSVKINYNLIDSHVYICSPKVLVRFSDNFDYHNFRSDYISKEVANRDFEKDFYFSLFIPNNIYLGDINSPYTYDKTSQSIIGRWLYPIIPDRNITRKTNYTYRHGNYIDENVNISLIDTLIERSVIGSNTTIDDNCIIKNSVIGSNCRISKNVRIENSYIWNGCTINEDCDLKHCIIGSSVNLGKEITTMNGSIIGSGCCLKNSVGLYDLRFTIIPPTICDYDGNVFPLAKDTQFPEVDKNLVGEGGKGYKINEKCYTNYKFEAKSNISSSNSDSFIAQSILENRESLYSNWDINILKKCTNFIENDDNGEDDEDEKDVHYTEEIKDYLLDGIKQDHDIKDIHLEINVFLRSKNLSLINAIEALVPAMLDMCPKEEYLKYDGSDEMKDKITQIYRENLSNYGELLKKFITGMDIDSLMIETVDLCEIYFLNQENGSMRDFFPVVLRILEEESIITKQQIINWSNKVHDEDETLYNDPDVLDYIDELNEEGDDEDEDEDEDEDDDEEEDDDSSSSGLED